MARARAVPIEVEENVVDNSLRTLANQGYGVPKRLQSYLSVIFIVNFLTIFFLLLLSFF